MLLQLDICAGRQNEYTLGGILHLRYTLYGTQCICCLGHAFPTSPSHPYYPFNSFIVVASERTRKTMPRTHLTAWCCFHSLAYIAPHQWRAHLQVVSSQADLHERATASHLLVVLQRQRRRNRAHARVGIKVVPHLHTRNIMLYNGEPSLPTWRPPQVLQLEHFFQRRRK